MSNKKTLGLALVFIGFLLLALTGIRTISNPELFTHIALGQARSVTADTLSYTMDGQAWINMTPLYNSMVYLLWSIGGAGLVTLVHVLVVLAAFVLMLRCAKEWGGPLSQGLALLLCAQLMLPVFNPGPGVFLMLFTSLFLTLLYRVKNFNLLAILLLALQVLWTNIHPSFLFGPLLILFFAMENNQKARTASRATLVTPLTARLLGLCAASLAVTLINPNLINLHRHLIANWALLTGKENLEWISLFSGSFQQSYISSLVIFALVLGAGGLITLQKQLPVMLTLLALIGSFLTVTSIGSLHLFAFLAFPFMILSLNAISEYLSRTLITILKISKDGLHTAVSILALVLLLLSMGSVVTNRAYARIGSASHFGLGIEEGAFPVAAAGILNRTDFPERILHIPHDGGYIALQNPDRKIFCDTRSLFYGLEFYQTLNKALLGQPDAWKDILARWNPHAVVVNACWPDAGELTSRLIASRVWKLVYFDGATVILVRNLPEYATLINDPAIQKYGMSVLEKELTAVQSKNKGLMRVGNSSRLIGAGSTYLALNRLQQAEEIYTVLVKNNPAMAGAWLGLGQSQLLQKRLSKGLVNMEKAADITPQNGRVWMALFQAYRLKGDEAKARRASEQLNKFFKADKATVEQKAVAEQKKPDEKPAQKSEVDLEIPKELK